MNESPQSLINADTKLLGLIGENISYSVSPLMHNAAANRLRIPCVYLAFSLGDAALKGFLQSMWQCHALGFNVTQPHKEIVATLVKSDRKSVNTLFRGDEGWKGFSTDGPGFDRGLTRLGRDLGSFQRIVFLGNGGAVTAILEYIKDRFHQGFKVPHDIVILRRRAQNDDWYEEFEKLGIEIECEDFSNASLEKHLRLRGPETLCVQATSAPLFGDSLESFSGALDRYQGVFVDLIYGKPSSLYFRAIALDLVVQDGEAMLIEQARMAQEIWWGKSDSYQNMATAIRPR